ARATLEAAAQQVIKVRVAAQDIASLEFAAMLQRDEAGENVDAARANDHVVVAAAIGLAAIFDDTHAPPLGSVIGRTLFEAYHAVGDAVRGLVHRVGGEIVESEHGGTATCQMVLDGQHLTAVTQRALRQKSDLRQAVDDDAGGMHALDLV